MPKAEVLGKGLTALIGMVAVSTAMPRLGLSPWLPLQVLCSLLVLLIILLIISFLREHDTSLHQRYDQR